AYLCRKLCEHGAVVYIVGEAKTPSALRNASDQFFEWVPTVPQEPPVNSDAKPVPVATPNAESKKIAPKKAAARRDSTKGEPAKEDPSKPSAKRRPRFVVDAVELLAGGTSEGKVDVATVGHYLKRTDPAFSPQTYGHSGLLSMLKSYDLLLTRQETGGHWS